MKIKRVKAIFGTRKVIQWQVGDRYFDRWGDARFYAKWYGLMVGA